MGDVILDWLMDPNNRTKVYFAINIGMILTNILVSIGAIILILRLIGYL